MLGLTITTYQTIRNEERIMSKNNKVVNEVIEVLSSIDNEQTVYFNYKI